MIAIGSAPRRRCLLVWTGATAAAALLLALLVPGVLAGGSDFADLLVRCCAAVLAGCVAWAWLVTSVVVLEAVRGQGAPAPAPGCPWGLRSLVLRACGLALAGVAVSALCPAQATPDSLQQGSAVNATLGGDPLVGLPLPDRAPGGARRARTVTVAPGDTLWGLAARRLPDACDAAVAEYWPRVHRANRAVVGADPDLLRPGQLLRLPPPPPAS
ncbi:hypothetical protein I601_0131 [Nocardioides dokdonensis FR1436]|uniref:LysM domain-containing protein n=1 Tax=Nocardioides dokdonensis FR1436 TaxID=1300347 RepID=A0A1A9GGH4_9ACTN|nr:LysM domain-containing protein [Nocardioides dokdonensis]ANH36585.1 hypothetical protein I601_0131 [Nocardioides dokdonensis FR1436]